MVRFKKTAPSHDVLHALRVLRVHHDVLHALEFHRTIQEFDYRVEIAC